MQTHILDLPSATRQIPCHVGENLWQPLREHLKTQFPKHAVYAIADSQVAEIYAPEAEQQLAAHPEFRGLLQFPAGEQSKCRAQKDALEDALLAQKAGRDTVLVAFGGGVTGDLVGYVAATLHRGVPLVHLPTTLLAMVDSSIGGKTGINHPAGKNLIGAFYQPDSIFCDVRFLKTLSKVEFLSGMAEVIKYAVIMDDELWHWLESEQQQILGGDLPTLTKIISRCAQDKINVAAADEKESGLRGILNFGHTVGHAVEKLSNFSVPHGFAVATGMVVAARLSVRLLNYPADREQRLFNLLRNIGLLTVDLADYSFDAIWDCILSDKKSRQQAPRFSLMNADNQPELLYPIQKRELEDVLKHA